MYYKGEGVPQDYTEAMKWYRLAAEQGNAVGQYNLGLMYRKGEGVPQDDAEAVKWYSLAAEQGYYKAQHNLAAVQGHKGAMKNRDIIKKEMSSAQIAEGQKLSRELLKRISKKN